MLRIRNPTYILVQKSKTMKIDKMELEKNGKNSTGNMVVNA